MKLIDADALRKDVLALPNCYNGYSDTYDKSLIIGLIDEQIIVDAVPVVRCERIVKLINDLIDNAVHHGADCGGAYFTNEEGLIESARKLLDALNLNGRYAVKKLPGWHDSWSDIAVTAESE